MTHPAHNDQLIALKRIEGQIRGIQKMIGANKYCVDIVTQLHATIGAILRVEDTILKRHFQGCVANAFRGKSEKEKEQKIAEVLELLTRFRRS